MTPDIISTLERELRAACGVNVMLEFGPLDHSTSPYAVETELMKKANAKRQREFYSGRHRARKALQRAGVTTTGLARGTLGNPIWPQGCIGSITHDQQWAAAIAVKNARLLGLGIDLLACPEMVTSDLSSVILSESERIMLVQVFPTLPPTGLAFSLKESVVKTVSVLSGRFLDLLDIRLKMDNGTVTALVEGMPTPVRCEVFPLPCGLLTFSYLAP